MNDRHLSDLLEWAADRVPVGPAPDFSALRGPRPDRLRRTRVALVGLAAVVLAVGLSVVVFDHDRRSTPSPATSPVSNPRRLSAREAGLAESYVRSELASVNGEDATVTSLTAWAGRGMVRSSNTGHSCLSGRLLHVRIIGTFPHIVVAPPPWDTDTAVHAVNATLDPRSGRPCVVGVQTGRVVPAPDSTHLDLP